MVNRLIWQWLIPTMLRFPVLCKVAMHIYTKKLAGIVIQSVNNYQEIMDTDSVLFKAFPISRGLMAFMALMPAALIYGYLKLNQETEK